MVTQAETGRTGTTLVKIKEWLAVIGAVVVILGGLLGGMRLVVAPLYTEMQALNGRMDRMDARMQEEFGVMREEFKAVRGETADIREDIAALSERLTRVETLLERDTGQPAASDAQP